jgi:hypothetical protein
MSKISCAARITKVSISDLLSIKSPPGFGLKPTAMKKVVLSSSFSLLLASYSEKQAKA